MDNIFVLQGVRDVLKCRPQRDALLACSHKWMENESFRERVTLEYLNERSHYRQTGIATVRYFHGKFVARHVEKDGTPFDENGHYRPRKPTVIKQFKTILYCEYSFIVLTLFFRDGTVSIVKINLLRGLITFMKTSGIQMF